VTLAPSATRGTAGINRFTQAQLLRTARLFASDPDLATLVDSTGTERQWVELDATDHLQIWLLSWPAGTSTGWHDHDRSTGAFLTVTGRLLEQTWRGGEVVGRPLEAGDGRTFGPGHIHNVANVGAQTALSLHLYTPRLTAMTRYAATPAGLKVKGVERAGADW
jgi:quercetin dioxygenase-like cupin family protein